MSAYVLISPQTASATSPQFIVQPTTWGFITANGLAGVETVTVQVWDTAQSNWYDLILDGVKQTLDLNTNVIAVMGSGFYRIVKSATVAPVGASLER